MSIDYANLTLDQIDNMSDEDFAKLDPSQFPTEPVTTEPVVENQTQEAGQQQEPEQEPEAEQTQEETQQTTEPEEQGTEETANENTSEASTSQAGVSAGDVASTAEQTQEPEAQVNEPTVEKTFFDKVTAEFNANGKQFKIDNPDDVVSLMQKGLNYNQKMAALKPSMKMVKALQDAGIESVEDLGFLLDLKANKPEAIAKLVQDSGLDTYEFEQKAKDYTPSVPQVSDEAINFQMTAQSLEGNPHFGKVVQGLQSFDEVSKEHVFKNPGLLNVLTDHVRDGYYDKIVARLELEQSLGRYIGIPFLQAYTAVGDALFKQETQQAPVQQQQPVQQVVTNPAPVAVPVATKPKAVNNTARQAAAGTTSTAAQVQKTTLTPEDIWNMSDEEFKKIDPKFL